MRPERIVTLMNYIADKEPLIYLFLINCDFIEDETKQVLKGSPAGVAYKDKRVIFFYDKEQIENFTKEELFFLIIHEAFHILKKHHERHAEIIKKNQLITNMAEDAAINHEIKNMNFTYELKAHMPQGGIMPPDDFIREHRRMGDDAIETFRIFSWMFKRAEENRQKSLDQFEELYNKKTGERGMPIQNNGDGTFKIRKKDGTEQDMNGEDLIPVIKPTKSGDFQPYNGEAIYEVSFDKHLDNEKKEDGEESFDDLRDEIERRNFAETIIEQATQIEEKIKNKQPGKEVGNLTRRIKELNKPKVNWRKELKKSMNTFISNNSYLKSKIDSPVNYPYDPKSNYGLLGKHAISVVHKVTNYIIFALDTSGSVFYSEEDVKTFFTELDFAAKELSFSRTGKILTMQWDWDIAEGLKEYKRGSWENYNLKGGGGTNPGSIFRHLDKIAKPVGNRFLFEENGVKFMTRSKKELPYLVILTDGYFYPIRENELGIYKNNPKNILWITRETNAIYPKDNFIQYR